MAAPRLARIRKLAAEMRALGILELELNAEGEPTRIGLGDRPPQAVFGEAKRERDADDDSPEAFERILYAMPGIPAGGGDAA